MQAYKNPITLHSEMIDLAMELLRCGHEFHAGAISSLAYDFQKQNDVEIEARNVENPEG